MSERLKNYFGEYIPASDLDGDVKKELTVNYLEKKHLSSISENSNSKFNELVRALLSKYKEGDIIVWHRSRRKDWHNGCGSEGYALIRDGYFVESVPIRLN
jgi:hypothetical protein